MIINSVAMADVGCGRGGFVNWMAESGWAQECRGVDVDARSLPANAGASANVSFSNGNCLAVPFPEGRLDLLTSSYPGTYPRPVCPADGSRQGPGRNGHILIEVPDAENCAEQAHRSDRHSGFPSASTSIISPLRRWLRRSRLTDLPFAMSPARCWRHPSSPTRRWLSWRRKVRHCLRSRCPPPPTSRILRACPERR